MAITKVNQVWAADITYVRLKRGFMYLVAVIDIYSRKLLSWQLSNTLETEFCVESLEDALQDAKPEIFNTDQGSQFTSHGFTDVIKSHGIRMSFIERFWRSLKYECLYLKPFETVSDLRDAIKKYVEFYNSERIHQSLGYKTPQEVYSEKSVTNLIDLIPCGNVENPVGLHTVPQPLLRS
ncbi:IS3 family transposase [bacterium]|nr:IS3 family transposase [bacterium]